MITRDLKADSFFKNALEGNGYEVNGISFIETIPVKFDTVPATDWIFFASSTAVDNFFKTAGEIKPKTKYGVIGKSSELALKKYNKNAAFVGSIPDTKVIGRKFAKTVGQETVLFPQAKGGLRTIQQQFSNASNLTDLVVYETVKKEKFELPKSEVLVFTSPSNVESYFANTTVADNQKVIAIAKSTDKKLKAMGVKKVLLPV